MCSSTKEKIKKVALSLFAKKGYEGTTMNEIAVMVGIKKASLYAHFNGKEGLFFSVYEDLARDYVALMDNIMNEAESMETEAKLYHIFEQYVVYYVRNPEVQAFWNQITMFTPSDMREKFFSHVTSYDLRLHKKLEEILAEGMEKGVIRKDNVAKMAFSYRALREGLVNWMLIIPELYKDEYIEGLWRDLWLGFNA